MKKGALNKIAIVGPESSGKTFLAENLAAHFKCLWVPEYAREYLEKLRQPYTKEDVERIAKGQMESEDAAAAKSVGHPDLSRFYRERSRRVARMPSRDDSTPLTMTPRKKHKTESSSLLICDTNLLVIKIWMDDKYGSTPGWIENEIAVRKYDLHLLTAPDIPYEDDPLRENPERGEYFFNAYEKLLRALKFPYSIISGANRMEQAARAIQEYQRKIKKQQT